MKKLFVLIACYLLSIIYCYSQTWQWAKSGGGTGGSTGTDGAENISVNNNGESFITGAFMSNPAVFGSYNLSLDGWSDVFIVKYDSNGNVLWAKKCGSSDNNPWADNDNGQGITTDNSGNCYVTGEMRGSNPTFDTITLPSTFNRTFFLAKYNSNGNCQWAKMAKGITNPNANVGYSTSIYSNYLYACGSFIGATSFDSYTVTPTNSANNVFITRYDVNNGNCLWVKAGICSSSYIGAYPTSSCVDKNGNCYVTGIFYGSVTFDTYTLSTGNDSIYSTFLAKYDSSGNCLWAKSSQGLGLGISLDAMNPVICGTFKNSISIDTFNLTSAGGYDILIAKYDTAGNCLSANSFGGSGDDYPGSGLFFNNPIAVSPTGNVIIVGNSTSPFNTGNCQIDSGIYIISINPNGNCNWKLALPHAASINIDTSGSVFFVGGFSNTITFGSYSLTSVSGNASDVFVAKLNTVVSGVPSNNQRSTNFNIYPNPSDGTYTMEISPDLFQSKMHIYDSTGREIFQTTISKETTLINLPTLSSGAYIVKLQTQDGKTLERSIIKQ